MKPFIDPEPTFPYLVPFKDDNEKTEQKRLPELIIITGMSGAGRTRAAAALEDLDWYVVDNLPPRLLKALAGMVHPSGGVQRLAAVVDVRSGQYFESFQEVLDQLRESDIRYHVLFLDASDKELVRRYEQSRRPHPLQGEGTLLGGITRERELLEGVKRRADVVIDTTSLSVHDLGRRVRELVATESQRGVKVTVMSFGFKHGLPLDADHVVDVRFIPNPYWVNELRHLTGKDHDVAAYVFKQPGVKDFVKQYVKLITPIFAGYERELKPYVTIAIGCTGGKHRSVAIAESIASGLRDAGIAVAVQHRDVGRE